MESDPRPDQVDEDEADRRRYGSRYQEIGDRPPTNTADLADVAEAGDAERQRSEHEGHDRHQEHPQEDLAHRTGDVVAHPLHLPSPSGGGDPDPRAPSRPRRERMCPDA